MSARGAGPTWTEYKRKIADMLTSQENKILVSTPFSPM